MDSIKLLAGLNLPGPLESFEISGLAVDSRKTRKGDLFFAIPGAHTDGNIHIKQAVENGAAAVITGKPPVFCVGVPVVVVPDIESALSVCAAAFYNNPSAGLQVIGITGTNGKTTTAYLLESIFNAAGRKTGVIGTISYRFGGKTLGKAVNTTPNALVVQGLLAEMSALGADSVIMEVSSHSLCQHRVDGVMFDAAVFTNLSSDHLDYHITQDSYFAAKRRLFEQLVSPENRKSPKRAALNGDDARSAELARVLGDNAAVSCFGLNGQNRWRAKNIIPALEGVSFTAVCPAGEFNVSLKLWGEYNVYNALAAAACAEAMGIAPARIIEGLNSLSGVPGRMERVSLGQNFHVFVDFAHTGSALGAVLGNLRRFKRAKIYTVFGCGGERDRTKRGPMGAAVCSGSDWAFITADNPRRENLAQIFADIEAGLKAGGLSNYSIIADREAAVYEAVKRAREGDIILLAGKGHEEYQLIGDETVPFSDKEVVTRAILKLARAEAA